MIVAIHQPNYLPWIGYFTKLINSDVFVLLDNVQYSKNSYTNRVLVKTSQGPRWLTQPVATSGRLGQQIRQVEFAPSAWPEAHLKALQVSYGKATYFRQYFGQLSELLTTSGSLLSDCNERLIRWVCDVLDLPTPIVRASTLVEGVTNPTERLIRLVQAVGGTAYLSGAGGFGYQDLEQFEDAGIRVEKNRVSFGEYPQLWGAFTPGLSIVDVLFNCGPESQRYLEKGDSGSRS